MPDETLPASPAKAGADTTRLSLTFAARDLLNVVCGLLGGLGASLAVGRPRRRH